ncbi:hypothetical protein [Arthrobacter sp. STN4]|uniref:hypothetical protein n=1 Tax=Arthrobacter sp. STN4 TaxID=2923276 RepID=UPI002119C148|nr:hypothetical protein [Arthrobacter sp. STN4]MCQ9162965.1 hypothetical protein [Arthrobacter sp. STN4]
MNTQPDTSTDAVFTAQELITQGAAYRPARQSTEAELPDGVWLAATALEISHLTGITVQEAAEVVSRNQALALASRQAGASLFQVADHAVATREAA